MSSQRGVWFNVAMFVLAVVGVVGFVAVIAWMTVPTIVVLFFLVRYMSNKAEKEGKGPRRAPR